MCWAAGGMGEAKLARDGQRPLKSLLQPPGPHSWGEKREPGDTPDPGSILLHRDGVGL